MSNHASILQRSLRLVLACLLLAGSSLAAARKPNILHIHADDHRPDGLRALGNPVLHTPNLDKLVATGVAFTHCYTQGSMVGAVCLPSRTMLLTGKSWLRVPRRDAGDPDKSLPRVLNGAGYDTFHAGKGGNEYTLGLKSFDRSVVLDDRGPELRRGSSERHADAAVAWLRARTGTKPFYMYIAPPVPHDPRVAAPEFHRLYEPDKITLSKSFMPQHPFDNGEMTVRDEKLAPWPRTPEDTRRQTADYYACISGLDHHVGRIFKELEARGEWTNTIVVFSGDNGLSLGEHGLFGKQNLYEFGGMHVPLVMAGPRIPHGRRDALVYLMDLYPTFVEFAGGVLPEGVEGKSLRGVIEGSQTKVRNLLYTGYRDCQRAIRNERWKLIRYPLVDQTQLFDLASDPLELNNLAGQSEYSARLAELTTLLKAEMARYGDNVPLTVAQPKPAAWTPPAANTSK